MTDTYDTFDTFDVIIVGAGMAGLYMAYNLRKRCPHMKLLVLEANRHLGGRAGNAKFFSSKVVTGAGIGRKSKDKLLHNLIHELGLTSNEFPFQPDNKLENKLDIMKVFRYLKRNYRSSGDSGKTFRQFATDVLGSSLYRRFIQSSGYSDYENEDAFQTLHHYGMDDNACCWTGFTVPWSELIDKMADVIGHRSIKTSAPVKSISCDEEGNFIVKTPRRKYRSSRLVLATTISQIRRLLPSFPIYDHIKSQSFLRLYGKFSRDSAQILKDHIEKYTIVNGPLQKIIPIDREKGIYMMAYNDNRHAETVYRHIDDLEWLAKQMQKALHIPTKLSLVRVKPFYWREGTHYYAPGVGRESRKFLRNAQFPYPGLYVVGEAVSLNQGWVEGALESVKTVLKHM